MPRALSHERFPAKGLMNPVIEARGKLPSTLSTPWEMEVIYLEEYDLSFTTRLFHNSSFHRYILFACEQEFMRLCQFIYGNKLNPE